ncbi:MAG: hypothetical protein M5U19_20120 [Microthrixaceae bacterium]|nr:hypothetical protein [Microthrixaceae bacterium]
MGRSGRASGEPFGGERVGESGSGDALARWRVWAAEQWVNECLIDDGAPDAVRDVEGLMADLVSTLGGVEVGGFGW